MDSEAVGRDEAAQVVSFGNLWVKACVAAHQSLSQLSTSFVAVERLGILGTPFFASHSPFSYGFACFYGMAAATPLSAFTFSRSVDSVVKDQIVCWWS